MKIVEVKIDTMLKCYDNEARETVMKTYGMPIPTSARIKFCATTIAKIRKAEALVASREFNKIEFISTTMRDFEHCFVELLYDGQIIPVSQYEDFNRYFDTFDSQHFNIVASSFHSDKFIAKFFYSTGSGADFGFKTKAFKI